MITNVPFQNQKPIFHKLENIADMAKLTREEREFYHVSLDSFRTNLAVMKHERNVGRAEGREQGLAEGRAEGREQGRAEGHAEGRAEGIEIERQKAYGEKIASACALKALGTLTNEQIANALQLPLYEVEKL